MRGERTVRLKVECHDRGAAMRFSLPSLRGALLFVALVNLIHSAGCGNSCFVGFSNNGNGGLLITASNPPPACPSSQGMGTMLVFATKEAPCEICTDASRVDHVFLALSGIALRESPNSSTWVELAPQLANEPLQIDLIDSSFLTQTLVENAIVPPGSYREIRIQFAADPQTRSEDSVVASDCGKTHWNCIVTGNGYAEPLFFPNDSSEVMISRDNIENNALLVLPGTKVKLRLTLQAQPLGYSSLATGWRVRTALIGRAARMP